jgi:hypothetical protein
MKNTILKLMVISVIAMFSASSCDKPPGPGGRATIKGKVYAVDFDNTQRYKLSEGYSSGERVYICYGDNEAIGNDTRTSTDGSFEFRNLTQGDYKVFVNSLDTSIKGSNSKGNDTEIPVIRNVKISGAKEVVTLKDFIINK